MSTKASATVGVVGQALFIKKAAVELIEFVPWVVHGFIMFIMSVCTVGGQIFPFSAGYCSTVKSKYILGAVVGGILGCWVYPMGSYSLKYISAIVIIGMIKTAIMIIPKDINEERIAPFIAAVSLGIPTILITFALDFTVYGVIMGASEIVLAAGSSYFFLRGQKLLGSGIRGFSKKDTISAVMAVCIIIAGLYGIKIAGISAGGVLSTVLVLCTAYSLGTGGGATIGSALGFGVAVMNGGYLHLMAAYPLGGVISGVFKPMGRLPMAISFCAVNIISCAIWNSGNIIPVLCESAVGGLIFMAIPIKHIFKAISPSCFSAGDDTAAICHVIKTKLVDCSKAILDVKETAEHVSFNLDKRRVMDLSGIYENVCDNVCRYCSKNTYCWQDGYNDTMDTLNKGVDYLKEHKSLSVINLPVYFQTSCLQPDTVVRYITDGFKEYIRELKTARSVARLRDTVSGQLEGVSMMMESISSSVYSLSYADASLQNRISGYFCGMKIDLINCLCYADSFNRLIVEITVPIVKAPRIEPKITSLEISDICEKDLDLPTIIEGKENVTFVYREITTYKADLGICQRSAYNQSMCGDYCRQFLDNRGNAYTILSDGMGNGKEAALQAAMTVDMLRKLIEAGADYKSAMHLVNSTLIAKSERETISTIDIAAVDLYTGCTEVFKAGAAPTYLIKENRAGVIRCDSLPVGIIKDVEPQKYVTTISFEDFIVTISDGVTATGDGWIASQLMSLKGFKAQEIADSLCNAAWERRNDSREDDVTVAVIKLGR